MSILLPQIGVPCRLTLYLGPQIFPKPCPAKVAAAPAAAAPAALPQHPSSPEATKEPSETEGKPRSAVVQFFLSLRFLLAAFCVVAVFVAAFLAWHLTYTTGLDTVQSLAKEFEVREPHIISPPFF